MLCLNNATNKSQTLHLKPRRLEPKIQKYLKIFTKFYLKTVICADNLIKTTVHLYYLSYYHIEFFLTKIILF